MTVWIIVTKNRTVRNRHAAPTNSNVNLVDVFRSISDVTRKTIVAIIRMSLNAAMSLVRHHNLHVPMDVAFQICGNVRTVFFVKDFFGI